MIRTAAVLAFLSAHVACGPACPDDRCSARTPEYRRAQENASTPPQPPAPDTTAAPGEVPEAAPAPPATEAAKENAPSTTSPATIAVQVVDDVDQIELAPPTGAHQYSIVKLTAPEIGVVPAIDIAELPDKDPAIRSKRFELVNTSDRFIRMWVYELRVCKDGAFQAYKVFASLSPRGTKNLDRTRIGLDYSGAPLTRCNADREGTPAALHGTFRVVIIPVDGKAWRDDASLEHTPAGLRVNAMVDRFDARLKAWASPRK